jgi:hypothetical protein
MSSKREYKQQTFRVLFRSKNPEHQKSERSQFFYRSRRPTPVFDLPFLLPCFFMHYCCVNSAFVAARFAERRVRCHSSHPLPRATSENSHTNYSTENLITVWTQTRIILFGIFSRFLSLVCEHIQGSELLSRTWMRWWHVDWDSDWDSDGGAQMEKKRRGARRE